MFASPRILGPGAGVTLVAVALGATVALAALAGRTPGGDSRPDPAAVYRRNCASCHGADGRGRGPAAYDPEAGAYRGPFRVHHPADLTCPILRGISYQDLVDLLRAGRFCPEHGLVMPAFDLLRPSEMEALHLELRRLGERVHEH